MPYGFNDDKSKFNLNAFISSLNSDLFYKAGDVENHQTTAKPMAVHGITYDSAKKVDLYMVLPKSMKNIDNVSVSNADVFISHIRTADGGYLGGSDYLNLHSYLTGISKMSDNMIRLRFEKSNGWNTSNNSVVVGTIQIVLYFS